MIRTVLKLISLNDATLFDLKFHFLLLGMIKVDKKYFQEFRCPNDNKLLAKGYLKDQGSVLEAKCRACGQVSYFQGEDKEIIMTRQELLQKGEIPDTE
jgi:phage FluMu protein Com